MLGNIYGCFYFYVEFDCLRNINLDKYNLYDFVIDDIKIMMYM